MSGTGQCENSMFNLTEVVKFMKEFSKGAGRYTSTKAIVVVPVVEVANIKYTHARWTWIYGAYDSGSATAKVPTH